ncbi:PRC-barrel domain-containing protein [Bradyrhizobium sp. NBAIM20]|uniref:PRC-barrel domain-containing protein n=1 Tax=unclassified Bradyrhizobium TaxID=2631580 RepID=UPI001CD1F2A5|nr:MULTISPECIES: PRC-barrel domain-containing protein [unclassified Bradyrhizobium]MCA1416019.1 PRC-barrel domain-containing protein [Bradyrhizobium sp. NBAIM20]MCA1466059.1 PRC-barrel domain-containing protein [Bradyrhizobium sp. NBAIM18]
MNRWSTLVIIAIGAALSSTACAQNADNVQGIQKFSFSTRLPGELKAADLPPDPNGSVERERYCLPRELSLLRVRDVKPDLSNARAKIEIETDLESNCFQVTVTLPPPRSVCATVPRISGLRIEQTKLCELVPTKVSFAVSYEAQKNTDASGVPSPAPIADAQTGAAGPNVSEGQGNWPASKLIGTMVYNDKNEVIGEIEDLIADKSGAIKSAVLGVGGFLGMNERLVAVDFNKVRFSNEPISRVATSNSTTGSAETTAGSRPTTTGAATASSPQDQTKNLRYPDHAIYSISKDELKSMPEFKYSK